MSRRAAAPLLLGGCDPLDFCQACIKTSPALEVSGADLARIRFTGPGALPATARRVHYYEKCRADCLHWMRFELPEGDARRLAAEILGGAALRKGLDPFAEAFSAGQSPSMPWWPASLPADAEGAKIETQEPRGGALAQRDDKGLATVWFYEFDK